ncbi:prepilin-type N-terminal cleavage/methylation domain-containing protein, partial [bacterium]
MPQRAFTLIELLVVIAIIAVLAAILFPVFAQAKVAALKTQAISNMKQQGTASILYAGDNDDLLPQAVPKVGGDYPFYMYNLWVPVPQDLQRGELPEVVEMYGNVWINSTAPYRKSEDLVSAPGLSPEAVILREEDFVKRPTTVGLSFNGLLNDYPLSSVASPSALPMYTQVL